ncbi:MAG: mandelate racemase/muconate lactonizing enzyme family protein [Mucilaginibacter sp.]
MHQIEDEIFNIVRISIRVLEPVNVVTPFQDATMGPFKTYGLAILSIEDEDGNIGEAPSYSTYTNILETCLFPILFNSHGVPYRDLYHKLYWAIRNEGFKGSASALLGQIDMALYDLDARRKNVPLHRYMGSSKSDVSMYGSGGGTNYTYQELENEISVFVEKGVDCYKMKVGKDFGNKINEDVERVKFVKTLLGKDIKLAVDANQIWTCHESLKFLDAIGEDNIYWFEEPIHSASYEQIEELAKRTTVSIAYGESERTSKIFPTLVNSGVRHLQPVPSHLGGITEWMQVRDLATKHDLDFSSGGYSLFTSAFIATAPDTARVEYLYSLHYSLEKYFLIYPAWKNGRFILPEITGLPVRINWDYCAGKITQHRTWDKSEIKQYSPNVSI